MQCDKPRVERWGRPNQVCNIMENVFEANWKNNDHWVSQQPCTHTQPHTRYQVCFMSIRRQIRNDVKKNGHVIFLKYSLKANLFLFLPIVQMGIHKPLSLGEEDPMTTSHTDLRCAQKNNKLKLFVPITSNKNAQKSNKNPKDMMGANKTQLLKQAIKMPFIKMKLKFHQKWGGKPIYRLREPTSIPKSLGLKTFQKLPTWLN